MNNFAALIHRFWPRESCPCSALYLICPSRSPGLANCCGGNDSHSIRANLRFVSYILTTAGTALRDNFKSINAYRPKVVWITLRPPNRQSEPFTSFITLLFLTCSPTLPPNTNSESFLCSLCRLSAFRIEVLLIVEGIRSNAAFRHSPLPHSLYNIYSCPVTLIISSYFVSQWHVNLTWLSPACQMSCVTSENPARRGRWFFRYV
jgi:hypothetical protein